MASGRTMDLMVSAYAESWQAEHIEAMNCFDLEEDIQAGIALFRLISEIDTALHCALYRGESIPDSEFDRVHELYNRWSNPCRMVLKSIEALEAQGYEVRGAKRVPRNCREARGF